MPRIAVVYHSVEGTTAALADAVIEGATGIGTDVTVQPVALASADISAGRYLNPDTLSALDRVDAIIFGSPTFMGGPSAQFKAFADASSETWERQGWRDRLAAGFTIGSNLSGDQLATIQYFQLLAMQHGMIWVGLDLPGGVTEEVPNRLGAQGGLIAHATGTTVDGQDLQTARYLGRRVAGLARRLHHCTG